MGPILNDAFDKTTNAFASSIAKNLEDDVLASVKVNINMFPQSVWTTNFGLISNEIQRNINNNIPYSKPGESYRSQKSWTIDSINSNPLCKDLNVQGPDQTKRNIEQVQLGLTKLMQYLSAANKGAFAHLYRGEYPLQGNESALSYILRNTKWVGLNSVSDVIRDSDPLKS
jgi:hypothetical protein